MVIKYFNAIVLVVFSFVFIPSRAQLPDSWTQRRDYAGITRAAASSFVLDGKGYVGLGYNFSQFPSAQKDFWAYDPFIDSWTQISDFPLARSGASGCATLRKGYIIAGYDSVYENDIWEYDPPGNTWTQMRLLPATGRHYASAFAIGDQVYFGAGEYSDFWKFDPAANQWTRKADIPGLARSSASSFSIGNTGYIATGYIGQGVDDCWAYDTTSNSWSQKADVSTNGMSDGCAFTIGGFGYICAGTVSSVDVGDLYQYDPLTNTWTRKATLTGDARANPVGFGIGDKGYVCTGTNQAFDPLGDLWEYTPDSSVINNVKDISAEKISVNVFPNPFHDAATFSIGNKNSFSDEQLIIADETGKQVRLYSLKNSLLKIGRENLSNGIYFYKIISGDKRKAFGSFVIK